MKKQISAEIIADSKNEHGQRITTFVLTFPRIILAELNTHRMFSRNSASSRAIPFNKMVEMVKSDPFIPIAWQKDHKGMQGTDYFTENDGRVELAGGGYYSELKELNRIWLHARDQAVASATVLNLKGATKQLCNRLLEPFMWHTAILTATDFENFFKLRCPQYQIGQSLAFRSKKDMLQYFSDDDSYVSMLQEKNVIEWLQINSGQGEIHIMELAEQMWDAMNESTPKQLKTGEWHIPDFSKLSNL